MVFLEIFLRGKEIVFFVLTRESFAFYRRSYLLLCKESLIELYEKYKEDE